PKPLTPTEWGKFAKWLHSRSLNPESLIDNDLHNSLQGWEDKKITFNGLQFLLNRGAAMGLALEKWTRAGLWVLCRSDAQYPERLKHHLGINGPPVLFGCGNLKLLNKKSYAVIGSRNATDKDLDFTRNLGGLIAANGLSVISGGARGVDEASMMGALKKEGTVIGVLAHGLLQSATSRKYRAFIMDNNLVLVSPFYPEAGFNVGNAMARNKYIYCLSEAAVVVHSGTKGGTWNGALENLKKKWVPLWVKRTIDSKAGNQEIVMKGGNWLSQDINAIDINSFLAKSVKHSAQEKNTTTGHKKKFEQSNIAELKDHPANSEEMSFCMYDFFLSKIKNYCRDYAKKPEEIQKSFNLTQKQANVWLKRAVDEKEIEKLQRPVRYQVSKAQHLLPGM
ncbi:MAG: DNA-processing protein DprA, partial [Candidatus Electrothrix sp. AR5]|nr:DNA-processing protein DprA [Candidatus Electrothrix sp. AR5]